MHDVVLVDPDNRQIRHVRRIDDRDWVEGWLAPGSDAMLHSLGTLLPELKIFADDWGLSCQLP